MAKNQKIEGEIQIKLVLLGDGKVGKTSLRKRFLGQGFPSEYLETLGADFSIKNVKYHDKINVKFNIWDIAGQPRFSDIRKGFYTGSQAAFILYDITSIESFNNLHNWVKELIENNGKGSNLPVIIIANKIDLREEIESISPKDGKKQVKELENDFNLKNLNFLETSAKTNENVNFAFELITKEYLKLHNLTM